MIKKLGYDIHFHETGSGDRPWTANTVIFHNDKIILDEPSIIAVETKTGKLIAVGAEAQLIEDHTNPDIMTIRSRPSHVAPVQPSSIQMITSSL